ncbi:MAG: serine hydrolase [Chlorobi bacterium]|nr:serine hydrolase [Chlorobiota bacterium]
MKKTILFISILSLLFAGCKSDTSCQYTYRPPENINDGFDVGTLNEVNIDSGFIIRALNKINQGKYKEVHSMLIFKDDKLVFEEYFRGHKYKWDAPSHHGEMVTWNRDMLHSVMSVTKSITSACIGIAIDHGFIESVHQSVFDYLPEHQQFNTDGKDKITIEHLLTMTSGLEWDEWGAPLTSRDNDILNTWFQEDPVTYVLEKPLINEPGTSFTYNGGGMIVLGEVIKNATKMNIAGFSEKYLFEPLGIDPYDWLQYENGVIDAAGGLKITSRDMVKIGVTFLNKGVWNGKQIISGQWAEKSAASFPGNNRIKVPGTDSGRNGYAYSWWTKQYSKSGKRINMNYAGGWGGQYIMVFPELNTVVVFTGGTYTSKIRVFKILEEYVIPAIEEYTLHNNV